MHPKEEASNSNVVNIIYTRSHFKHSLVIFGHIGSIEESNDIYCCKLIGTSCFAL